MDRKILILFLLLLNCCQSDKQDEFYRNISDEDLMIVPLIKPFSAKKFMANYPMNKWIVTFNDSSELPSAENVKKIDVKDSIIYIWCGKLNLEEDSTLLNGKYVSMALYVVDTKKQLIKAFQSKNDLYIFLRKFNYRKPNWKSIDSLNKLLNDSHRVPWYDSVGIIK